MAEQMRDAGFSWDPAVWMSQLDGPRRNLSIEIEKHE
jgi:hypothetical protein